MIDVTTLTREDFIGPSMVDERFAFDGRSEDYDAFRNLAHDDASLRYSVRRPDGYKIAMVDDPDFDPSPTTLVFRENAVVGFYARPMVWVDPEHRGRGLARDLIVVAAEAMEEGPMGDVMPMGFSEAGLAAHEAAWRCLVEQAISMDKPLAPEVAEDYEIVRMQRQARAPAPPRRQRMA